jgi:hypothetical protein
MIAMVKDMIDPCAPYGQSVEKKLVMRVQPNPLLNVSAGKSRSATAPGTA